MKNGYDGVYFERTYDVGDYGPSEYEFDDDDPNKPDYWANNVALFNLIQFKSATDNIGTFDGSNPDIQMMVVGEKGAQRGLSVAG